MTTPPSHLIEKLQSLPIGTVLDVRSVAGSLVERVSAIQALALAIRGTIEGVGPRSGALRFLRELPESARPVAVVESLACEEYGGRSTAFARTNIGAYREQVESSAMNEWGIPTRIVIGHIWQLCEARL